MKRFTALLMCLVFVSVNIFSVLASDTQYQIEGCNIVVLPAHDSQLCMLEYELVSADGSQKADAEFSISGNTHGLFISAQGTLFTTTDASEGDITINALYNGISYTKEVSIKKGYSEDFESCTIGEGADTVGYGPASKGVIQSDASGKYLYGYLSSSNKYAMYSFGEDLASENITLELDYKAENGSTSLFQISGCGSSEDKVTNYYFPLRITTARNVRSIATSDGGAHSGTAPNLIKLDDGVWSGFKTTFNFVENTFTSYINDTLIAEDWKLSSTYSVYQFKSLIINGKVDNISVYSGTPVEASITAPLQRVIIPEGDNENELKLTSSLSVSDAVYEGLVPTWELKSQYAGVSIDDNTLVINSSASEGSIVLVASFGNLTAEKTVELFNPTIRLSTENEKLSISALENTDYELSVYSSAQGDNLINSYVYEKDTALCTKTTVNTNASGKATLDMTSYAPGKYHIEVKDTNTDELSSIQYISKLNVLLADSSACDNSKFESFLTEQGIENANKVKNTFSLVTDRSYVIDLTEGHISNLPFAAALGLLLEQTQANEELNTYVKSIAEDNNTDSLFVDLLSSCAQYTNATAVIKDENPNSISALCESIYRNSILCGVAMAPDALSAQVFLEGLDFDFYNNARRLQKEYIAEQVYGNSYESLNELKDVISGIDISLAPMDCEIKGASTVVIPAKQGQMSSLKYTLIDNDIMSDADASFSLETNVDGLYLLNDGTLITSYGVKPGTVVIKAKYQNRYFEKELALKTGYFTDFENDTVGALASGWENRKSYVKQEENGNKFMDGKRDGNNARLSLEDYTSEEVTVEFDTIHTSENTSSESWTNVMQLGASTLDGKTGQFYFSHLSRLFSGKPRIVTYYDEDGSALEDYKILKTVDTDKWYTHKFVFDYSVPSYTLYIDDELVIEDSKFNKNGTNYVLTKLIFSTFVDNVNVYSGNCDDVAFSSDAQRIPLPKDGEEDELPIELLISIDDESYHIPVNWEMKAPYSGVSVEGNNIKLTSDAPCGYVTLVTTLAGNKIEKKIEIYNPSFRASFSDSILNISGTALSDYSISVYAPAESDNLIDKFSPSNTSDKGSTPQYTYSVSAGADGNASLDLSVLSAGRYNIYVEKTNADESLKLVYLSKAEELLLDTLLVEDYKFEELLTELGVSGAETACSIYRSLNDKSLAGTLCSGDIYNFSAAVSAVALIESDESNDELNEFAKSSFESADLNSGAVDLLSKNTVYTDVTASVKAENNTSLTSFAESLHKNAILIGIKNVVNKNDAIYFLNEIGSEKFNSAADDRKKLVANTVAKKSYSSISELKAVVDAFNFNQSSSGGGGVGSMSTSSGSGGGVSAPAPVTKPAESENTYTDVSKDFWAYSAINELTELNIISGFEGTFRPNDHLSRAEMAKIISVAAGLKDGNPDFNDVTKNDWFYPYVGAAMEAGLINGYDGKFNPYLNITRQDVALILYRLFGNKLTKAENADFTDADNIADYAREAVATLSQAKIINGYEDGSFKANNPITRAEIAQLMVNCITLWKGEGNE